MTATGFTLGLPATISFGPGAARATPTAVRKLGSRVLVATGSSPQRVAHIVDEVVAACDDAVAVMVAGEPTIADARAAAAAGRDLGADVVLAVGGGSVIDLAKAVAMLLGNGGDPLDYLEVIGAGKPITAASVPFVAVPTTAGTGAEVTANAVLASPEHGLKASLRSPTMIPRHAIVDPELTFDCPPAVTASAGMDALTQCLEPFVSNKANPVTDAWATTGLFHAGRGLRPAYANGGDPDARADMALASLMGGLALANAKLGAVHGFAGVLGGMSPAPHGAICAALLAPVCRANIARSDGPLLARYAEVARQLTADPSASAEAGLAWIDQTRQQLQIPGLAAFGLTADQAPEVAAKAARASSMQGNPVKLDEDELIDIYLSAL